MTDPFHERKANEMRDPAVEAAQRSIDDNGGWPWNTTRDAMEKSAREALNPIRAAIEHAEGTGSCYVYIEDIEGFVYTDSELARRNRE